MQEEAAAASSQQCYGSSVTNSNSLAQLKKQSRTRMIRPIITSSSLPRSTRSTTISSRRKTRRKTGRSSNEGGIERRLKTLKNLIPNSSRPTTTNTAAETESTKDLDELLSNTAEYILSLQTRVLIMRTMVDQLEEATGFQG